MHLHTALSWAHWHILCSITEYCFSLQEKDGGEEVLFTHDHISNSTSFKGRVRVGADYELHLSPVQIQDNGRTFSCRLSVSSFKVWKTSTTVKVFGKEFSLWSFCHPRVNASGLCHALPMRGTSHPRSWPHPGQQPHRVTPAILFALIHIIFIEGGNKGGRLKNNYSANRVKQPEVICRSASLVASTLFASIMFPKGTGNFFNYNCQSLIAWLSNYLSYFLV